MNVLITAIWLMLPAYLPNNFAALLGGGAPVDLGKNFLDGRRIFGNGKTMRGMVFGTSCGLIAGLVQNYMAPALGLPGFGDGWSALPVLLGLSLGSMLGDLTASFLKRRLGMKRGDSLFMVDQLDFVLGSWALTLLFSPTWYLQHFTSPIILIVLLVTPVLHRLTNIIGYKMGAKKEPW
ncbi:MAG: CDP-2,3-bis-(O-geranylgeranyl)-sn-glycerol synthase [Methanotrichaceae archaeon]|nr:CDP-2,3-bis-(O-geranylgeranyl)-sn-glycerol synthase [Methanotrichaceae archaeon]